MPPRLARVRNPYQESGISFRRAVACIRASKPNGYVVRGSGRRARLSARREAARHWDYKAADCREREPEPADLAERDRSGIAIHGKGRQPGLTGLFSVGRRASLPYDRSTTI